MAKSTDVFALPAALQMDTTALKKSMGQLRRSLQDNVIEVTKHGKREAVIVDPDRFDKLTALAGANRPAVAELEAQYDAMVAGMQTKEHDRAMDRLKSVSSNDLRTFLAGHYAKNPLPPMTPAQQLEVGANTIRQARKRTQVVLSNVVAVRDLARPAKRTVKGSLHVSRDALTGELSVAKAKNVAVKKAKA